MVDRVREGQYEITILRRKDEIGRLSAGIHAMSQQIMSTLKGMEEEQKKLSLAVDKLSLLDQQQKQFIGNVTHEFKTPLTSMKAYLDPIGGARSATWTDNDTVIGAAYSGGAYLADRSGKITSLDDLKDEALYLVAKVKDQIYYNTQYDQTIMKLDLTTKEKTSMDFGQVSGFVPSYDGNQMLIIQTDGTRSTLLVYDIESGKKIEIAKGSALYGVSWSPDQRRIAYCLNEDQNDATANSLYVYDMLTGVATRVAVNTSSYSTSWSPSGEKLAFTQYDGTQYNSSIIYFK